MKGGQRIPPLLPPFYRKGAQGVKGVLFVPEEKVLDVGGWEMEGREQPGSNV